MAELERAPYLRGGAFSFYIPRDLPVEPVDALGHYPYLIFKVVLNGVVFLLVHEANVKKYGEVSQPPLKNMNTKRYKDNYIIGIRLWLYNE